jgi:hypothetical protein
MDLDADARLSKTEFIQALRPEEPYSKLLKRTQLKKCKKQKSQAALPKVSKKNDGGLSLVLDESQKDEIRMFALDREGLRGCKKGEGVSLKVRPVICKDLTIFGTPRSQNKSRTRFQKSNEMLNLANSVLTVSALSPTAVKSPAAKSI